MHSLFSHFLLSLLCTIVNNILQSFKIRGADIIIFYLRTILPSLVLCFDTHTAHAHALTRSSYFLSLSLSCILLYFCFISCFALHTQHKTCYCSFDALLSAVQCMCAFQPLSFQYRTTMMHFSLLKHTHNTVALFFSFSFSQLRKLHFCLFWFSLRDLSLSLVGIVVGVVLFLCVSSFCLLLLLLLYVYDSTITLNNLVCCFSVSNGGCCFVPQRRGIRETRVGDDCCSTIALLLLC